MNKRKRPNANPSGFTMVEVILFFAVSAALMLGIISGITRSISRQRYNDTVNDFAEYIRGIYSDVQAVANSEVAGTTAGRSKNAIYGKLLRFDSATGKTVQSSTLSGLAINSSFVLLSNLSCVGSDTLSLLGCTKTHALGDTGSYTLIWDGKVEATTAGALFSDCILVVRSPESGAIHTYRATAPAYCVEPTQAMLDADPNYYNTAGFSEADIDFCVQSDDNPNSRRRNIRIKKGASNSSGVAILELDSTDNKCE